VLERKRSRSKRYPKYNGTPALLDVAQYRYSGG